MPAKIHWTTDNTDPDWFDFKLRVSKADGLHLRLANAFDDESKPEAMSKVDWIGDRIRRLLVGKLRSTSAEAAVETAQADAIQAVDDEVDTEV